jgi:hypothetical protein
MTRMLTRTNFHSSKLIRCLADMAIVDAVDHDKAFSEKLGLWIHFADAITLSAVHNDSSIGTPKIQPVAPCDAYAAAVAEFGRVQALLVNSITNSCSLSPGKAGSKISLLLPKPPLELPLDMAATYTPYRRFYEAHQRDMELCIQPLRVRVREALAKSSPKLKKLIDLDTVFENILRDRERLLLAKVPVLLKRRFEQLFKEHQQKLVDTHQPDNPALWMQAQAWLARFCNDMQMLLLAEAELRLQPTMGLLEAFEQNTR